MQLNTAHLQQHAPRWGHIGTPDGGTTTATPPGTDREGRGYEQRSRSRCTKENARLQELGHGGGGASGMAERPALRGREQPTLAGGRGPPGHLQLRMLIPLLLFLRAPGPSTRCRACSSPPPAPALTSRSRQASAAPQPPWQPAAPRDGAGPNSHHKPPRPLRPSALISLPPSPKPHPAGAARKPEHAAGTSAFGGCNLRRAPTAPGLSSQGLPHEFSIKSR